MNKLESGEFYGAHYQKKTIKNIVVTDTEYTHDKVDWHYHEHPYFTYLLQGKLFESNKKKSYYLESGSLLFHNWQDAHYNVKPPGYTRGFHVELRKDWFEKFEIQKGHFEGSDNLKNPMVKHLMNQVFIETKINDPFSNLTIESSLIGIFETIKQDHKRSVRQPIWTGKLKELLHEERTDFSLSSLSEKLEIHPVHLSREFNRYFGTSLSTYVRLIKLNKALSLLASSQLSMTEICYECGFYDQSHFISSFKRTYKTTPLKLLKKIGRC